MALIMNRYGKGRVRIMRVDRGAEIQTPRELTVQAILTGEFSKTYTQGDNASTVSTDTVKNVVNVVARANLDLPTELFCKAVADRFLHDYPHVEMATISALETRWTRLMVDGKPHPHSFTLDGNGKSSAQVVMTRSSLSTSSGVDGFTFLKTTESGWSHFYEDPLTTIKPTTDRLCSTSLMASWDWSAVPADYPKSNALVLDTMMSVFATTYSNSVQDSLYRMGMAALAAVPEIATISMAAPNKHYLPMNLAPFGMSSDNTVFLPTDEPHGQIECTVGRD